MPVLQSKRNKNKSNNNNNKNTKSITQLQVNAHSLLLLLLQLSLLSMLLYVDVVRAAELPAELMLEGVSLLKSMEYAQQKQQQQHQQQHPHTIPQMSHMLHEQTKRFPFDTINAGSTNVDIDTMQLPEMSPADIARFERELFLQSALDETSLMSDDMELPLEPNSMEQHADLMERTIDYKQHQPTGMWSQQHGSSQQGGAGGGGGHKVSSTFLKSQHPHHLQQQQQQPQQQHQHPKHYQKQHLSVGDTASANSVTLAPPPSPVAAPQRHCAIEISTKLTGVCQAMAPVGTACVAGDYMDVYNQDCM